MAITRTRMTSLDGAIEWTDIVEENGTGRLVFRMAVDGIDLRTGESMSDDDLVAELRRRGEL